MHIQACVEEKLSLEASERALMPLTMMMMMIATVLMVTSAVFAFPVGEEANSEPLLCSPW